MIDVNGQQYRTLEDNFFVNGEKVTRAYVNGEQVYPDDIYYAIAEDDIPIGKAYVRKRGHYLKWIFAHNSIKYTIDQGVYCLSHDGSLAYHTENSGDWDRHKIVQEQVSYDAFGNITEMTETGVTYHNNNGEWYLCEDYIVGVYIQNWRVNGVVSKKCKVISINIDNGSSVTKEAIITPCEPSEFQIKFCYPTPGTTKAAIIFDYKISWTAMPKHYVILLDITSCDMQGSYIGSVENSNGYKVGGISNHSAFCDGSNIIYNYYGSTYGSQYGVLLKCCALGSDETSDYIVGGVGEYQSNVAFLGSNLYGFVNITKNRFEIGSSLGDCEKYFDFPTVQDLRIISYGKFSTKYNALIMAVVNSGMSLERCYYVDLNSNVMENCGILSYDTPMSSISKKQFTINNNIFVYKENFAYKTENSDTIISGYVREAVSSGEEAAIFLQS